MSNKDTDKIKYKTKDINRVGNFDICYKLDKLQK